jgi:hypothetical protein
VHGIERDRVESLDYFQLPVRELDAVELLIRQDVLWLDWARPVEARRTPHALKGIPERQADPGPFDLEQWVDLAGVLCQALEVRAQGGAVALPRC